MPASRKVKYYSKIQALERARKYCVYQERCQTEVRNKLFEWGQRGISLEDIIAQLISENFIDEERFAKSFARGKFRMKKWGTQKIISELKQRNISDYCIQKALLEIQPGDMKLVLKSLLEKKALTLKEPNAFKRKQKLAAFAIRKGYNAEFVWELLRIDD